MGKTEMVRFSGVHLKPDPSRTVVRPFDPEYPAPFADEDRPRVRRIIDRVLALDDATLDRAHDYMVQTLTSRHRNTEQQLTRRFEAVLARVPEAEAACPRRRLVIGAYFSEEYSFEAAALFNPSIMLHPEQEDAPDGGIRFLLSLRGIGEGHISSVTFRTGSWSPTTGFAVDAASPHAVTPRIEGPEACDGVATKIICEDSEDVSESVLFPVTASQRQGIEDLRMVRFVEEDGTVEFYGTYTAFDGRDARSELLRGTGFKTFEMRPLTGDAAAAKGMALFPRRVGGRYMMLGRQDNESIWLLASDDLYHWEGGAKLVSPAYAWDFVQMGNCGSPVEIDEGWLVVTHGVGMVRTYCVGACLLDRDDPSKVLARTPEPILRPSPDERDGYVPNVVYSCGAVACGRTLLLPYGVADNFAGFASVDIDRLLAAMR